MVHGVFEPPIIKYKIGHIHTCNERIYFVKKEKDVTTKKAIAKINKILNHKKIEQMEYAFRNAGKLNSGTRKTI